jgi:hypothetical protein
MVSEAPNGATEPAKDVELSQSDKNQDHEESLDKVHKEERTLPAFFPSHGLTTAGKRRSAARGVLGSRQSGTEYFIQTRKGPGRHRTAQLPSQYRDPALAYFVGTDCAITLVDL